MREYLKLVIVFQTENSSFQRIAHIFLRDGLNAMYLSKRKEVIIIKFNTSYQSSLTLCSDKLYK